MNDHENNIETSVADANVERLIQEGYRPETLDAQFVARVQEQMLAAATQRRAATNPSLLAASPPQLSMLSAGWGIAILLLIGIIAMSNFRRPAARQSFQTQGDIVWIDGKAYVAESMQRAALPGTDLRPLDEVLVGFNPSGRKYDVSVGLVAKECPQAASPKPLKVGDSLSTTANEQRRLTLPDGSVLFVDENTEAKLVADRQVEVTKGEIFVEVSPKVLPDKTRGTFLVKTTDRSVTALGTKFGVRTGESPRVLVTQGKVDVSGIEQPLGAGQQFVVTDGIPVIESAPRADVALGWMRELVVAAEGALVPDNEKAGGDLIAVDPDGQDVKLSLRKYHIDVHIEDGFARTTIDQTYFNHMWSRLEGTFYFPLPPDASLSRLAMYVGPKLMEGGMAERDYARQVFETIKTRQLDPALLEWVDGSTFKMRVFPLEGRQEKRIILSYTQKLDISYGRTRYRFPAGHNMKVVDDWSVKVRVKGGRGLLWDSPSHTLESKKEGRDLVLTAEEKLSRLDKDVVLFLNDDSIAKANVGRNSIPSGAHRQSALLGTTTHEDSHYLMLRWRPELPTEKIRQRRDWVFLFESSADRDPLLARTQIEIIRTVLNHAEHDDTFAIVSAGAYASAYQAKPQAATPGNITQAIEYLNKTHLVGGLDLQQAFRSLETFTKDAANPVIVHVGSGTPILGERERNKLVEALPQDARYVGVGVGKRFNRSLMKQAAARSGGYFTQINPDESISWRGFELVSALNTPRLLDIKIATDSGACPMLSLADSLAHGEELCALGRYEEEGDAPDELTITGQLDGQAFTQTVPVKNVKQSTGPLPRMWAKQQIELLTSLGAEQHKDQIIKLSKAMYVMSPFTSLLVLENDEMYEQYKIDRGRKDHWALYPAPETIEVVEERDEGRGARDEGKEEREGEEKSEEGEEKDEDAPSKPSVEEVLNTILVHRPAPVLFWPNRGYNGSHTTTVLQAMNVGYGWPLASSKQHWAYVPVLSKLPHVNRLFDSDYYSFATSFTRLGPVADGKWGIPVYTVGLGNDLNGITSTSGVTFVDSSGSMSVNGNMPLNFTTPSNIVLFSDGNWQGENRGFLRPELYQWNGAHRDFVTNGRYVNGQFDARYGFVKGLSTSGHFGKGPIAYPDRLLEETMSSLTRGTDGAAEADFDSLIDLITATVRPDTWEDVGGPGTIEAFPGNLSLVISQTQTVHDELRWGQLSMIHQGRAFATGGVPVPVRLWNGGEAWNRGQSDGGWYYSPHGRNFGYENSVDWFVRNRLNERPLGLVNELSLASLDVAGSSAELAQLQAELSRERANRAFALAALEESRNLESAMRRFDSTDLPSRYRDMVSQYYRVMGEDELGLNAGNRQDRLLRHMYFDIAGELPTQREVQEYLGDGYFEIIDGQSNWLDVLRFADANLPSPHYMLDDVQYFAPGPEFKLTREAAALKAFAEEDVKDLPPAKKEWVMQILARARSRRDGVRQTLASYVLARSEGRIGQPNVFYERPQFTGNNDVFSRLASYAPGLKTSSADVYAVLEAEADVTLPIRGSVDAGAKRLIDRARSLGWQRIAWPGEADKPAFTFKANGEGAYRYQRRTRFGLQETVLCDGQSLRHHYDEIGLGATRELSRFHRQQITSMIPWAVLPAGDLAIGGDLRLLDDNTIAIVPLYAELGYLAHTETHLEFADDGRLVQRRIVAQPTGKVLLRITYAADGTIAWLDGEGEELHALNLSVESTEAPDLTPDDSELVVLPMPAQTRDHVYESFDEEVGNNFTKLSNGDALRLLAADMHTYNNEVMQIVGQRFFAQGDRRLGFYTLMLNAGNHWPAGDPLVVGDDQKIKIDPLTDDAKSPLAQYISSQLQYLTVGHAEEPATIEGPNDGFLQELAEFRRQYVRWTASSDTDPFAGPSEASGKEFSTLLEVAERTHAPEFRWAMLNLLSSSQADLNDGLRKRFAAAYERLTDDPAVGYFARYEHAKALYRAEDYKQSQEKFTRWYNDTLAGGLLPRTDNDFRNGMNWNGSGPQRDVLTKACEDFVEQGRRPTAMTLAWQTYQLGDIDIANELAAIALADVPEVDHFAVTLSGVEYFAASGQQRRALVLLETLLSHEETEGLSMLWRLGSSLASQEQMIARSAKMLEQALALEYGALESDDVVNLEQLRNDYGELLNRYEQLANALATLEAEPSPVLLSRLISVADRWRSMEDDVGLPCNRVAPIFTAMGADELAWQYITTPLAARPNEAAPWLDLANNMRAEDNFAMADRAYREAFRSEGTNAQILWDHAGMLKELGRHEEARRLYERITNTTWQPRFEHFKTQAEDVLRN